MNLPHIAVTLLLLASTSTAQLSPLEQIPVATFEKMKEVERYQMRIAEKHYMPLDGGHMAVAIADGFRNLRAKRKGLAKPAPFDVERLTPITMVVFVLMASLSLLLLTADILNPIRLNF